MIVNMLHEWTIIFVPAISLGWGLWLIEHRFYTIRLRKFGSLISIVRIAAEAMSKILDSVENRNGS